MKKTSKHIHKKQTNGKKENREFIATQSFPSLKEAKEGSRKSVKLLVYYGKHRSIQNEVSYLFIILANENLTLTMFSLDPLVTAIWLSLDCVVL